MRASYGLIVLGIVIGVLGLLNHYVLHMNPVDHTSTIVGVVAAVLVVIGAVMTFMGRGSAAS
jgi:predicted tellurium resistance membrane protein TerC